MARSPTPAGGRSISQTAFDGGVGIAIGSSASARGGLRYSDGNGKVVGPVKYGARDTGTAYQTRDLTAYGTISHTLGSRFAGSGSVNYFRYRGRFADTIADPFSTYAILTGTPNALYPNGTRLVRLIDAAEFDALVAAGARPAAWTVPGLVAELRFPLGSVDRSDELPPARRQIPGRLQLG